MIGDDIDVDSKTPQIACMHTVYSYQATAYDAVPWERLAKKLVVCTYKVEAGRATFMISLVLGTGTCNRSNSLSKQDIILKNTNRS